MHIKEDQQRIAIVGIGATLPGALDPETYWQDQLAGRHHIAKIPPQIWDADLLFDPTRQDADRSYSNIGAVVRGLSFDPREFGMPPKLQRSIDISQRATLVTARQALTDAGINGPTDGLNSAVILGNLQGGAQSRGEGWFRNSHPLLERTLETLPSFQSLPDELQQRMFVELRQVWRDQSHEGRPTTSDCLPGLLGSITASRIGHYYNFRGPTQVIDAACASSLVALEHAVIGLRHRRFDLAVTGGVDFLMDLPSYAGFCALGALSPNGSFPFDRRADGFVMGEGAVIFVLKRLADAERDGNYIYATILGVGTSSDGRGKALVVPNSIGQARAMKLGWQDAGVKPESIGYFEAHGTATPLGDPTEVTAIRALMKGLPVGSVAMGSGKANIGHLKGAAGAAGLLRAVMSLHNRIVPPQVNFETPNPHCKFETSPVRVPREAEDWPADKIYAAVSAYGFGGINAHVVLGPPCSRTRLRSTPSSVEPPLGLGVIAFGANDRSTLLEQARALRSRLGEPQQLARALMRGPAIKTCALRVAFFAEEKSTAEIALDTLIAWLNGSGSDKKLAALGVVVSEGKPMDGSSAAFMFPGQGSQYLGMLDELRQRFPIVQATLDEADAIVPFGGRKLSSYLSPPSNIDTDVAFAELSTVEVLQPAMLACNEALRRLLEPLVTPRVLLGHSLGECSACVAAGVMSFEDALRLVVIRGEVTNQVSFEDPGLMLGVSTDEQTLRPYIDGIEGCLDIANKNCPSQTILAGATAAIRTADQKLRAAGFQTAVLPVSYAFHSSILDPVSAPLRERLDQMDLEPPMRPVLSNITGDFYPTDASAGEWIRGMMAEQIAGQVDFISMIERAYAEGVRVFVEVGTKRALHGFVEDILRDRPHRALHVCHPKLGEVTSLGRAVAALIADGIIDYGDPLRTAIGDDIEWRVPYVPGPATPIKPIAASTPIPRNPTSTPTNLLDALAQKANGSSAALTELGRDPRFQQYLAAQGPAIAEFLAASYRAAIGIAPAAAQPPSLPESKTETEARESQPQTTLDDVASRLRSRSALTEWVLECVARTTGYAREEISLDADLESELGIDSIRQIEIVVAVRDAAKLEPDDTFKMSDHPTLRSLIDYVAAQLKIPSDDASPPVEIEELPAPYFARRVVLERAPPRGIGQVLTPVLVLHCGAPAAALDAFTHPAVSISRDVDENTLAKLFSEHQPASLVDLTAFSENESSPEDAARAALARTFRIARAALSSAASLHRVLIVTSIDGRLGHTITTDPSELARRAGHGAAMGAWKCIAREYATEHRMPASLSIIDIRDASDEALWKAVARELPTGGPLELALSSDERSEPVLRAANHEIPSKRLEKGATVVAFGGGRGITALICRYLAEITQCRLVLVGRTSRRHEVLPADRAEARQMARQRLGVTAPITEVNKLAADLERAAELERTLDDLAAHGIDATYETADVGDTENVRALLTELHRRYGRIDLILHGAGVENSKTLENKHEAEFAEVLLPKLGPLAAMSDVAPEARWIALSSVAARLGNTGQMDYGAANEALAKATLARDGLVFDFSAWGEIGMAASLGGVMKTRGIDPLPPHATARTVAAHIAAGQTGEWVISGRLGRAPLPIFGGDVQMIVPGALFVQKARLEFEQLAYLRDHRFRTAGVLPAVVALAAMEQAALVLEPELTVTALRNVRLLEPAKVFPSQPLQVEVSAERGDSNDATLRIDCEIRTETTTHHRAEIHLSGALPARDATASAVAQDKMRLGPDGVKLYETFFHGPSFRIVRQSFLGEGMVSVISHPLQNPLAIDLPPAVRERCMGRELALQAASVYMLTKRAELALPVGIDELLHFAAPSENETLTANATLREVMNDTWSFDIDLFGEDGTRLEIVRGLRLRNLGNFGQSNFEQSAKLAEREETLELQQ